MTNNEVIAEFMGAEKGLSTEAYPNVYTGVSHNMMGIITVDVSRMKFHTSWDWLMPVVEKIEDLEVVDRFDIYKNDVYIWAEDYLENKCRIELSYGEIHNPDYSTKIEAVYNAILTFIKWYNTQNQ